MTQRKVALVCRVDQVVTERRVRQVGQACRGLKESAETREKSEDVVRTADLE